MSVPVVGERHCVSWPESQRPYASSGQGGRSALLLTLELGQSTVLWPVVAAGSDAARTGAVAGSPVLTAPVSAVPALFATVRARPGPFRPNSQRGGVPGRAERAGTRSDGRKQGRNSADGCGEDRE